MGNGGLKKKKKKKLIARVGIHGHIYYMNKRRQFLNSLWPFCMIKINLALENWSFAMQCQLISNNAKIQSQHVHKKRANDAKKRRNSTALPELGFLLGPITTFFCRVSGGRAAEHNQ